ncbi:MAG: hypothetical protein JWM88_461 [Verrucomicrobia bacterium]|nr:hypothetical protein [Verrucomicrobiota bacterium]
MDRVVTEGHFSRRDFLKTGAATGTALVLPGISALARPIVPSSAPPSEMKAHRNLFNGDCNFLFYNPELWQPEGGPYGAQAIRRFIDLLATSGVDTLLVNPNTQVAWYPSGNVEYVLAGYHRGDREFARRVAAGNAGLTPAQAERYVDHLVRLFDLYTDLTDAGVDWLAECAASCRRRGVSPWLSFRMNATHFSGAPGCPANARIFADPANRLSGRIPGPAPVVSATWVGLNYARAAVREHMLALMRDAVDHYDYEGLEMDWLRHPLCLEPGASARDTGRMLDWFASVKAMAASRRSDFKVGLRLPGNLGYLRSIGIDVKALVQRGLVDFITFSNFWQTAWEMPLDELRRELGPDVTLYGGMEDAPNWLEASAPSLAEPPRDQELQLAGDSAYRPKAAPAGPRRIRGTRYLSASAELMRANAAGKLVLGADGIAQFNFYVTDQVRVPGLRGNYAALAQLADLEFLRGREKHYAMNTATAQATEIWDVAEQLPLRIPPGQRRELRLPMCAEPAGAALRFVVQLILERTHPAPSCGVSFNGQWPVHERQESPHLLFPSGPYTEHVEEHLAFNYTIDPAAIREGWNRIGIHNDSTGELGVVAVECGIFARAKS